MGSILGTLGALDNACCSTESEILKKEMLITPSPRGRSPQRKHGRSGTEPRLSEAQAEADGQIPEMDDHLEWTERAGLKTGQPARIGDLNESSRTGITSTSAHGVPASTNLVSGCLVGHALREETSRRATCDRVQQLLDRLSKAEAAVLFGTESNTGCNEQTLGINSPRIKRLEQMKLAMIDHSRNDPAFKNRLSGIPGRRNSPDDDALRKSASARLT